MFQQLIFARGEIVPGTENSRHSRNLWLAIRFLKEQKKIVENQVALIGIEKPAPKPTQENEII